MSSSFKEITCFFVPAIKNLPVFQLSPTLRGAGDHRRKLSNYLHNYLNICLDATFSVLLFRFSLEV